MLLIVEGIDEDGDTEMPSKLGYLDAPTTFN